MKIKPWHKLLGLNNDDGFTLFFLFGAFAAIMLGSMTNTIAPIIIGALINDLSLTESRAGILVSMEFTGIALTSIFIGPFVTRFSKQRLASIGCGIAAIAHIISSLVTSYDVLLLFRFIAGLGTGSALVAGGATVAMSVTPDRVFAIINSIGSFVMAMMLALAGYSVMQFGISGAYGLMALFFTILIPIMLLLPAKSRSMLNQDTKNHIPEFGLGCLTIAGLLIWMSSSGLCYTFVTSIGEASGMSIEQVGVVLSVSFITGIGGGLLAAWLGTRYGRALPLVVGVSLNGITWWIVCVVHHPVVFTICIILNTILFFFTLPFFLGTAAILDRHGRWSAIASSAILAAMAVAPGIGGWIIEVAGMARLGLVTLIGELVALGMLMIVVAKFSPTHDKSYKSLSAKPLLE